MAPIRNKTRVKIEGVTEEQPEESIADNGPDGDGDFDDMLNDEYDSEGGDSGMGDVNSPGSSIKKRKHSEGHGGLTKKVKRPTAEEAIKLRETENLFQSNLFRLQIEEIMKEISPKKETLAAFPGWVDNLKQFLTGLEEISDLPLNKHKWLNLMGVHLPIPAPKGHMGDFNFLPPSDLITVGSVRAGCPKGPHFSADLAVVMPRKTFLKDDYLNQRYHLKRALYLSVVASKLKDSDFVVPGSLKFSTMNGDPLKPVLVFAPKSGKVSKKTEVVITAVPEDDTFKRVRFYPEKNNLRPAWFGIDEQKDALPPTPMYNMSITEDVIMETNDILRSEAIANHENIREAIALLRVWLAQRGLNEGYGAFSAFVMSMYIVHLIKIKKIYHQMSSYQIVRNVWLALSLSDWTVEGPSMVSSVLVKAIPLTVFHEYFDVVFVDSTGLCNLTARMNKYTYLKVKKEAELAIQYLDNKGINSFLALFMTKLPFIRQFDHIICFSDSNVIKRVVSEHGSKYEILDTNGYPLGQFVRILAPLLSKGLQQRMAQINFSLMTHRQWSLDGQVSSTSFDSPFMVGLKLCPEHALSLIDKGPEANLPEAAEFRSFWGDKSELRRFQDGRVCESVVWGDEKVSIVDRRMIVSKIIRYLFENKLSILPSEYGYIADNLGHFITNKMAPEEKLEESCLAINRALEELSGQLRDLPDLPLSIVSVRSLSPAFRFTEVYPPLLGRTHISKTKMACQELNRNENPFDTVLKLKDEANKRIMTVPTYAPPIDLVLQLESTRKWPNDIGACKRLLASFNVAIASALKKTNNVRSQVSADYINVFKNGYAFRLHLANSKEVMLLKERVTPEGIRQYRDTPESIELERKFINLPKISGALHGLSQLYPAFGSAAALAKRWLSAQLLDDSHFPQVVAELLVARLFLEPQPFEAPHQPQVAFLRFLNVLATTNWYIEPVIINFNGLLKGAQVTDIEKNFTSQRDCLPAMFVVTPYDMTGRLWTQKAPTLPNLVRLAKLAALALRLLETILVASPTIQRLLEGFRPPMSGYDCVILLRRNLCPRISQNIDWGVRGTAGHYPIVQQPIVGFDPAQCYLSELRENYGDCALFFHDTYGGSKIGVLFKPIALEKKAFKVGNMAGRKPDTSGSTVLLELNMAAIIEDFYALGQGMVEKIETKNMKT